MQEHTSYKHGHKAGGVETPTYGAWRAMKKRCYIPTMDCYHRYGGRGIIVCDRWLYSFENFLGDMGPRPTDKDSIDRIDNDGNYEPGNCRWATWEEQQRNRRDNVNITVNGVTKCATEWSLDLGDNATLVHARIKLGWGPEDAATTAVGMHGKPPTGRSRFKGVCWHKRSNKWQVITRRNGKQTSIGYFTHEWDAGAAIYEFNLNNPL